MPCAAATSRRSRPPILFDRGEDRGGQSAKIYPLCREGTWADFAAVCAALLILLSAWRTEADETENYTYAIALQN